MNKLINWLTGASVLWNKVAKSKTYLASTAFLLTGISGLLGEIIKLIDERSLAAVWTFIKGLPQDQNWALIIGSLATFGLRHAIEKTTTQTQ